ncbi:MULTISPECIES: hypothetical protein [unclassified Pseudomonas]|uniref:hypothetical protein n=1 Tax=unclassified Pseudomonas TaxID=196821 RepID=UPI001B33F724|nr:MULTISPECIES: hypothetical protein [unclassified Pseudomonas]MBP5943291.1 hypothetical protein [Pseudomonas sp. P9(2020)]MBZ9562206.1 hypothetical protein [Pseudomonas sp. P116]
MAKYIVFSRATNDIQITSDKNEDYISENIHFTGYCFPVWFDKDDKAALDQIKPLIKVRSDPLLKDVEVVCDQLIAKYPGSGFLSLGASPKLVKWRMKQKGVTVKAVNVSSIAIGATPSLAFTTYLNGKLPTLPKDKPIVVFDFTDSGASLYQVKRNVQALVPGTEVKTVAVGHSEKLLKGINRTYKDDLDHIFNETIPTLSRLLFTQSTKGTLGRAKPKNPYGSWAQSNRGADPTAEQYRQAKIQYQAAFTAGRFFFTEENLIEIVTTIAEQTAPAEDGADDFEGGYASGDDHDTFF